MLFNLELSLRCMESVYWAVLYLLWLIMALNKK